VLVSKLLTCRILICNSINSRTFNSHNDFFKLQRLWKCTAVRMIIVFFHTFNENNDCYGDCENDSSEDDNVNFLFFFPFLYFTLFLFYFASFPFISFYLIVFHIILFYFILFYFILFYFIFLFSYFILFHFIFSWRWSVQSQCWRVQERSLWEWRYLCGRQQCIHLQVCTR
jgi:hypothetical protein